MTGREKFEAAFSGEGTGEFAAVTCYQSLFLRDHWEQATDAPWWAQSDPDPVKAARPWLEMVERTGEDWIRVPLGSNAQRQRDVAIETAGERVFAVNRATGERSELHRPPIGGVQRQPQKHGTSALGAVTDADELAAQMAAFYGDPAAPIAEGAELDLPRQIIAHAGASKCPLAHITAPWWNCFSLWSFEELLMQMVESPQLVFAACDTLLQHALRHIRQFAAAGVRVIWIEDCMNDMISPAQYAKFSFAYLRPLTDAIRAAGMLSVHYYCGRPDDRWELLLDSGADALAVEESKKTFEIDIMQVAEKVDGRMALLGNIDAIAIMEQGSDAALQAEVKRQCAAGVRNGGRFVASIGSPVTPGTPLSRVRQYCDLVHA